MAIFCCRSKWRIFQISSFRSLERQMPASHRAELKPYSSMTSQDDPIWIHVPCLLGWSALQRHALQPHQDMSLWATTSMEMYAKCCSNSGASGWEFLTLRCSRSYRALAYTTHILAMAFYFWYIHIHSRDAWKGSYFCGQESGPTVQHHDSWCSVSVCLGLLHAYGWTGPSWPL